MKRQRYAAVPHMVTTRLTILALSLLALLTSYPADAAPTEISPNVKAELAKPTVKILRAAHPLFPNSVDGPAYVGTEFVLDLEIVAPKGAELVKVDVDHAAYGDVDVLSLGHARLGVRKLKKPSDGIEPDANGKVIVETGALVKPDPKLLTGDFPLRLLVTVVKDGTETVHKRNLGSIEVVNMKKFTLTKTFDVAKQTGLAFVDRRGALNIPTPFVCNGKSEGPAGSFDVGMLEKDGDVVFVARSGPAGNSCLWSSKSAAVPLRADAPWRIKAFNFKTTRTANCQVSGSEADRERPPAGSGTLRNDEVFIGKFSRVLLDDLNQPDDRFPILKVGLFCENTLSNDHFVKVQWTSIELEGPDDETVDQAFNGLIRH